MKFLFRLLRVIIFICFFLFFSKNLNARKFGVGTNIVDYANLGTLNLDLNYSLKNNFTLHTGLRYNPFTYGNNDKQFQNRSSYISMGVRYWPWHVNSGWFSGGGAEYGYFNYGGVTSQVTYEGWRAGANIFSGYSLMLYKWLNIEFGAGLFVGYVDRLKYACPKCGTKLGEDKKIYVAPNNILIQLVYLF